MQPQIVRLNDASGAVLNVTEALPPRVAKSENIGRIEISKMMHRAVQHATGAKERKKPATDSWWCAACQPEQRNEFIIAANARANARGWSGVAPVHRGRHGA